MKNPPDVFCRMCGASGSAVLGCVSGLSLALCLLSPSLVAQSASPEFPYDREILPVREEGLRLVREGRFEEGFARFLQQEEMAREVGDYYFLYLALWEQALHHERSGNMEMGVSLYGEAYDYLLKSETQRVPQWYFRFMLLNNLQLKNRDLGRNGEVLRLHRLAEDGAREYLVKVHDLDSTIDLYNLESPHLSIDFAGHTLDQLILNEAYRRGREGDAGGAIRLFQRVAAKLEASPPQNDWNRQNLARAYAGLSRSLRHLDRADDADEIEERLNALSDHVRIFGFYQFRERVYAAHRAIRSGEAGEELLADAREAVRHLREHRLAPAMFEAEASLARSLGLLGRHDEALDILDGLIEELRAGSIELVLSQILLHRAEVAMDAEIHEDIEDDLFEAVRFLRRSGLWRKEIWAHRVYARYLLETGRIPEALRAGNRAFALTKRLQGQIDTTSLESLREKLVAVAGDFSEGLADLQPLEMRTTVVRGDLARGRFTLSNPAPVPLSGLLEVHGAIGEERWNVNRGFWTVEILPDTSETTLSREVVVPAGEQIVVLLETEVSDLNRHGGARVTWQGEDAQVAEWTYEEGSAYDSVSVVTANLALENPFYPTSLYLEIFFPAPGAESANIRVLSGHDVRIELVDGTTGRLIAVDGSGDALFSGPDDILLLDADRDGFPELKLVANGEIGVLSLYALPHPGAETSEIDLLIEVFDNGQWRPAGRSALIPVPADLRFDPAEDR